MAQTGGFKSVRDNLWPLFVHPARHDDVALKRAVFKMMDDTGPETFIHQEKAIMSRPDSAGDPLSLGTRCRRRASHESRKAEGHGGSGPLWECPR
jgi:hypothetical protein